jgi:hypothetical protein
LAIRQTEDCIGFGPQRPFTFELRLFGRAISDAASFILPFLDLARTGLADRAVDVASVLSLDWMGRTDGVLVEEGRVRDAKPLALDLDWILNTPADGPRARIEFLTPTRLPMRDRRSSRDADSAVPTMPALVRRVRDRLSLLCLMWGDREWTADYGALGDLADRASCAVHDGRTMTYTRHSTKTGQTIHMTGFSGLVTYEGVHNALWPLLRIGQEIHAGRFTEWGLGLYRIVA